LWDFWVNRAGRTELGLSIFGNPYGYTVQGEMFVEGKQVNQDHR